MTNIAHKGIYTAYYKQFFGSELPDMGGVDYKTFYDQIIGQIPSGWVVQGFETGGVVLQLIPKKQIHHLNIRQMHGGYCIEISWTIDGHEYICPGDKKTVEMTEIEDILGFGYDNEKFCPDNESFKEFIHKTMQIVDKMD
jgi:hypothetical protein